MLGHGEANPMPVNDVAWPSIWPALEREGDATKERKREREIWFCS